MATTQAIQALCQAIVHETPTAIEGAQREVERARMQAEDARSQYRNLIEDLAEVFGWTGAYGEGFRTRQVTTFIYDKVKEIHGPIPDPQGPESGSEN